MALAAWRLAASAKRTEALPYFYLFLAAAIWGFAFVAQRVGMRSLDPFSFNAIRFALGALFVWLLAGHKAKKAKALPWELGIVLFIAATLQQVGIMYTGAGAAGFITGLYVVVVPVLGIYRKQKIRKQDLAAIVLALLGMLLINRPGDLSATFGNLLVFIGALFWALHVQLVDWYASRHDTSSLAFFQFGVCSGLSAIASVIFSVLTGRGIMPLSGFGDGVYMALWPLIYGGILSVGIAFTLQVKAQKDVAPAKAAVILCLEGVFALLGGALLLHESMDIVVLGGMALMFAATLLAVLPELFC